jgi:glycosyltransferase involved in cell wall biosynthesis
VLVGDGPEGSALRKRYPDFHFAGLRRGEDLAAHYASGDVFLFPSVTETFGNVVTEALGSGLVVVTYDYAAGREHIRSGVNGVLARFDDGAAAMVERRIGAGRRYGREALGRLSGVPKGAPHQPGDPPHQPQSDRG